MGHIPSPAMRHVLTYSAAEIEKALRISRSLAGRVKSARKTEAARENGKRGGRPSCGIVDAREIYRAIVRETANGASLGQR